jgi:hypothetical protein
MTTTVLNNLITLGFQPVTEWVLKGDRIGPASFDWQDHGGWLYAFVVEGEVCYIGLTDRVLRSRMSDYAHIKNLQTTRLRELITAELKAGRSVQVYGWKEGGKDALIAEESKLRAKYRPPWNRI